MENQPRRRRRTREEAKAETRQALLDAAAEVFAQQGFHGASIDTVAEAAGYTKGAVYAHFRSKEDLYLELLNQHLRGDPPPWGQAIESGAPLTEIAISLREQLPAALEESREWGVLTVEFLLHAMRNEQIRPRLAELIRFGRDDYARSVRARAEATGVQPPVDPDQLGLILMALDNGLSMLGLIDPEAVSAEAYSAVLRRLLEP